MDQFPQVGQFFGVTHSNGTDGSYRDDVWECLASDDHRIVAKPVRPCFYKDGIVFYRSEWVIQPVADSVVAALQVAVERREEERVKAA